MQKVLCEFEGLGRRNRFLRLNDNRDTKDPPSKANTNAPSSFRPRQRGRIGMDNRPREVRSQSRRAYKDLFIILIVGTLSFAFASTVHVFERFAGWRQKHGIAPIDELIIVLAVMAFTVAIFAWRRWRELQEAHANIKTLRGLLPICASCKKIRDDKGYWNQLEAYNQNNSNAEITHGICPDCMKKLYGDFLAEESDSENKALKEIDREPIFPEHSS